MNRSWKTILLTLLGLLATGCAEYQIYLPPPFARPAVDEVLIEKIELKAKLYEKEGQLQKSLYHWQILAKLRPGDKQNALKIEELQAAIADASEQYFQEGVAHFRQNQMKLARSEFLRVLAYDTSFTEAVYYLKEKMHAGGDIAYRIQEGDSFKSIARQIYGDSHKASLVAFLMGLDMQSSPTPGVLMHFPVLESSLSQKAFDVRKALQDANASYRKKHYPRAIAILNTIFKYDPDHAKARELANAVHYEWGQQLRRQGRYGESLQALSRVDPEYKDVGATIADLQRHLEKQAEEHYRRGVDHFVKEELQQAIAEWEMALEFDPGHAKAREDMENAQKLLEKLEKVE